MRVRERRLADGLLPDVRHHELPAAADGELVKSRVFGRAGNPLLDAPAASLVVEYSNPPAVAMLFRECRHRERSLAQDDFEVGGLARNDAQQSAHRFIGTS